MEFDIIVFWNIFKYYRQIKKKLSIHQLSQWAH